MGRAGTRTGLALLVALLLGAAGCEPAPPDDDAGDDDAGDDDAGDDDAGDDDTGPVDADGDGYPEGVDCDDGDADTYPGAEEICDGEDNDCDGVVPPVETDHDGDGAIACEDCDDDDPSLNLQDNDGDGYGTCHGDCDDGDLLTYPGATEICDGADNDCDGAIPQDEWDQDGDGYAPCDGDCNDDWSLTYPGAPEVCDGDDNDCDGALPLDETDADGDGYGVCQGDCDPSDPALNPADADLDGWSTCDGDCDDSDPAVTPADDDGDGITGCDGDCDDGDADSYPGAPELCDGVDNDCDGALPADEQDADGDGVMACGVPPTGGDCDDAAAAVYPGAPDVCDGALDNDCDGFADPQETDDDGDGASECGGDCDDGDAALNLVDGDGDGYSPCDGDCDDGEAAVNPAAQEVCSDGLDNDCDGSAGDCGIWDDVDLATAAAAVITGQQSDGGITAERGLAGGQDATGDGVPDVLVGAKLADGGGSYRGAVYLFAGPLIGTMDTTAATAARYGEADSDQAGHALDFAGDVDGDGVADVVIGALAEDTGGNGAGAAYVVLGPVSGSGDLSTADAKLIGGGIGDYAGGAVAGAGDTDGDGHDDVLVGAEGVDGAGSDSGEAYLWLGPVSGAQDLSDADLVVAGDGTYDRVGSNVAGAGDVDGDGHDDILIGARGAASGGGVYLFLGPVTGTLGLADAHAAFLATDSGDQLGAENGIAAAGDVDGDGFGDILLGAPLADGGNNWPDTGFGYLYYGPVSAGDHPAYQADVRWEGEWTDDILGASVAGGGDVDGDGLDDVLLGAKQSVSVWDHGLAYVVYGPADLSGDIEYRYDARIEGLSDEDMLHHCAPAGDQDGDGYDDVLIGAEEASDGCWGCGAVYLLHGGTM